MHKSLLTNLKEEALRGRASLKKATTIVTDASGRRKNETTGSFLNDLRSPGFVLDTQPDPGLFECFAGLYIGSQDAALNLNGTYVTKRESNCSRLAGVESQVQEKEYFPGFTELGITHVLNLFSNDRPFEIMGIHYLNFPLMDVPEQSLSHLDEALDFILAALDYDQDDDTKKPRGRILVHCNAGISRSSAVIIAYLIKYHSMGYQQALSQVRKNRPSARPNAGFEAQLLKLEKNCHKQYVASKGA